MRQTRRRVVEGDRHTDGRKREAERPRGRLRVRRRQPQTRRGPMQRGRSPEPGRDRTSLGGAGREPEAVSLHPDTVRRARPAGPPGLPSEYLQSSQDTDQGRAGPSEGTRAPTVGRAEPRGPLQGPHPSPGLAALLAPLLALWPLPSNQRPTEVRSGRRGGKASPNTNTRGAGRACWGSQPWGTHRGPSFAIA